MTLATTNDVSVRLMRPLTTAESNAATAYIAELSEMVRDRVRNVDALIAARPAYGQVVVGRIAEAVKRVLQNPEGYVQESVDDWSGRRSDAAADGALFLSADDWAAITPAPSSALSGAYAVPLWG